MNWHAKTYLKTAVCNAVAAMEKEIKTASELIKSAKLSDTAKVYFEAQILELIEAIQQVKSKGE